MERGRAEREERGSIRRRERERKGDCRKEASSTLAQVVGSRKQVFSSILSLSLPSSFDQIHGVLVVVAELL